jgi:hypothetical protein
MPTLLGYDVYDVAYIPEVKGSQTEQVHPDYRELTHRVSVALAMMEAAYVEARRRFERAEY